MKIQWNKVTWYSKLVAIILFLAVGTLGFYLGLQYGTVRESTISSEGITSFTKVNPTTNQQTNYQAYTADQQRITFLKANPDQPVTNLNDLLQILSFAQWKQLYQSANQFIAEKSTPGTEFDLVFQRKVGSWVVFMVYPENVQTDPAELFMEQVNGQWQLGAFGTAFPDFEEEHPELFK